MKKIMRMSETDKCYMESLCYYYDGDLKNALSMLGQGLSLNSDHKQSKRLKSKLQEQFERKTNGKYQYQQILAFQ